MSDEKTPGDSVPEDLMRYDLLAEFALRQVVRMALQRVQRSGLPGEHHFYIAFDTRHPGVQLSERLRRKYPEEMTIVLQHQFWDLKVSPERFEVGLSFGGIPEKLVIPFEAVKGFYDPHVQFALQFHEVTEEEQALLQRSAPAEPPAIAGGASVPERSESPAKEAEAKKAADGARGEGKAGEQRKDSEKVVSLDAFRRKT